MTKNFVFRSVTDLISLLIIFFLFLFLLGRPLQKSLRLRRFKSNLDETKPNKTKPKFGSNVLQVNTHQLTESDFRLDVTFSRYRPWLRFIMKIFISPLAVKNI